MSGPSPAPLAGHEAAPEAVTASQRPIRPTTDPVPPPSSRAPIEDERNTVAVFKAASPATVFVTQFNLTYDIFSMRATEAPAGTGTGFIWDAAGHVVTNYHVAMSGRRRPKKVLVTLENQKSYPAQIVGVDPTKDIAVLKINASGEKLTAIRLPARDYKLEVGQKAVAIGNPFGLDHTLTVGVVSALGRAVRGVGGVTIRDMIQTDAAINPGNSGGPLLGSSGQLLGMNTMIFSQSGNSAGVGFAVPVQTIRRVVPQIIQNGKPTRVGLGIDRLDDSIAARLGIKGVIIRTVAPNSPAARAGLQGLRRSRQGPLIGDVIVEIGETRIEDFDDLHNALDRRKAGDEVQVSVLRMSTNKILTVPISLVVIN